ncbi:hypothetical protein NGRA_1443 [Nosema granulosis]|uniref:Thioredoxin domain-containing protein n=1 Tax=Nosema granulosis TaxID=83296 RepID=A0A9P6GYG1_9MICR|nr:hypothetical protein NGRA_1443 [Nosema granulosis]
MEFLKKLLLNDFLDPKMPLTVYKFTTKEEVENKVKSLNTGVVIVLGLRPCGPCDVLENFIKTWRPDLPINLFELRAPDFTDMEDYREKFNLMRFPTVAIVDKDMTVVESKMIPGGNKDLFTDLVMKHKTLFTQ